LRAEIVSDTVYVRLPRGGVQAGYSNFGDQFKEILIHFV